MAQNGQRRTRSSNSATGGNSSSNSSMNNGVGMVDDYDNNNNTARYEDIMGLVTDNPTDDREQKMAKATEALSQRLALFKKWLTDEANVTMHPAICVVNGEATDGTRNAPLLAFELPTEEEKAAGDAESSSSSLPGEARLGRVDGQGEQSLYEKNIGCQIRTTREIKKDDTMMTIPRASMITPDLVASSDAGRAVLACCSKPSASKNNNAEVQQTGFWDAFTNTTEYEQKFNNIKSTGPQSLMKILQERKKVEARVAQRFDEGNPSVNLADSGTVSTRAPLLAFLIHQRFANQHRPPVTSSRSDSLEEATAGDNGNNNALSAAKTLDPLEGRPETFGPYARTLPSVVPMPLCWKRNELALLTGCIPGLGILQEVAAQTIMLASEFLALVEGGIMERFPDIFPPGVLTWDRWVWAASIVTSRILPASMYCNAGDADPEIFQPRVPEEFQSPPEIWRELGVLVPLLDMLNHEIDANQVTFKPCKPEKSGDEAKDTMGDDDEEPHPPMAIFHKKVKKGSEVFIAYGKLSNHSMILRYGMAQMNNFYEEVKIGFALGESVGGISAPSDYTPIVDDAPCVFETTDVAAIDEWWTADRLSLLQREAGLNQSIITSLQQGKKMQTVAYNDGAYHPNLIAACLVATVPAANVAALAKGENSGIPVSKPHLNALRNYLAYLLKQKVEKLLQNLESGLKAHFTDLVLWKKASEGGIRYVPGEGASSHAIGWQSFFDRYAYQSSMEVEKNYYAMGPDSCVLTLYDGQLRTLQSSLDGIVDSEKFQTGLVQQLEELGYTVVDQVEPSPEGSAKQNPSDKKVSPGRKKRNKKKSGGGNGPVGSATGSTGGGDKPPALKLHVGNLSYSTTPSDLYDYFSSLYGKEHVLECHIPIERASRRSRGFGFVTMPEKTAEKVLVSNQKHEIDGRLLKVAKSNSAGTSDTTRALPGPPPVPSDRCVKCGYRPKYCECNIPNLPPGAGPPPYFPPPHFPPEPPRGRDSPGYHSEPRHMSPDRIRDDYYRYERDRYRDDHHRRRDYDRYDREYDRDYDRDHYDRDYDIDRDRYRYREGSPRYMDYDRDERRSRSERSRERRRERSRDRSRDSRSPSRRRDDERRRDRDRDRDRERRPPPDDPAWDRERDRKRSRSRSRERSRKKKSKKREA